MENSEIINQIFESLSKLNPEAMKFFMSFEQLEKAINELQILEDYFGVASESGDKEYKYNMKVLEHRITAIIDALKPVYKYMAAQKEGKQNEVKSLLLKASVNQNV